MSWARESVEILIAEYKRYPCLYEVRPPLYKNKYARQKALENIRDALLKNMVAVGVNDIKLKFNALKTNFLKEHKKHVTSGKSGAGTDHVSSLLFVL